MPGPIPRLYFVRNFFRSHDAALTCAHLVQGPANALSQRLYVSLVLLVLTEQEAQRGSYYLAVVRELSGLHKSLDVGNKLRRQRDVHRAGHQLILRAYGKDCH